MSAPSFWADVPQGPPDPILGVTDAFKKDTSKSKVNLGVGSHSHHLPLLLSNYRSPSDYSTRSHCLTATCPIPFPLVIAPRPTPLTSLSPSGAYRDENGKPWVLESVHKAEDILHQQRNDKEYLPIEGNADFVKLATQLAYGKDSKPLQEGRVAAAQSISGTGALRIATTFLSQYHKGPKEVYLPDPTWGNHIPVVEQTGMKVVKYRYFDKKTVGLDFEGMKEDIKNAKSGSIILLHACAQNPTGIDPTKDQWIELEKLIVECKHVPLFDMAYQGFASGDLDRDAFAPRYFVEKGHQILLCQSFAKNLGLYGERAGTFSMVCSSTEEQARVLSQVKRVIRPLYSSPPMHGAQLVATILGSPELYKLWLSEVKAMAERIIKMRDVLYDALIKLETPGKWDHIKSQIGMFSFTGMTPEQVADLAEYAHIYLTKDGRISMAGLNEHNVQYFAESMSKAVKGELKNKSAL